MSRLIDADALVERIIAKVRDTSFFSMIMAEISNVIASLPTVDAERHGHWFDEEVEEAGGIYTYTRCSACGEYALCDSVGQIIETPYCPWCGAKMDEVRGEEDE